jgi:haloalkane dehalogenase
MAAVYRTPDAAFDAVPDFPFRPQYREHDGLRLAHIDEGHGAPVVFLHGEPTWSFLWRRVIPPVLEAGFRTIAPDLPGFGRSDKPLDPDWYTYDRHVEIAGSLLEDLDLRDATIVVHDWGGPIGLRLAVEQPDRIARMTILDTGLFTGHQPMTDAWRAFRDFVERTEDLPVSLLVRRACATEPPAEVLAAYDAPFPDAASKAGARAFPLMLPTSPEMDGAAAGQRVLDALRVDARDKLFIWADSDPVLPVSVGERMSRALGSEIDMIVSNAGHFLQEDAGELIGARIAAWLTEQRGVSRR